MGLFSRKSKDEPDPADPRYADVTEGGPEEPTAELHTGRPLSRPLSDEERERVEAALERLRSLGIDVDDLDAIGAGYDAAYAKWTADPQAEGPDVIVDTYAIAIGEHLARHSARRWAVVTDVFGTDLGLVDARADTVIVPHNLVGARWMRGEHGWIPGVVTHLVGLRPRSR
jgi:broad specificity phosphatase PhoE